VSKATEPPGAALLRSLLSTGTKADLLVLFHRNPGLIDTVDGIAIRLGRKGDSIRRDVHELESDSFLLKKKAGKAEVYYLNRERDKKAQEEMASYIFSVGKKAP
jgi:hypothetical protein